MSDTVESPNTAESPEKSDISPLERLAVNVQAACKLISVGETRLYELIDDKKGPPEIASYLEGGSRRRIPTSALREYVERQTAKGAHVGEAKGRKPPPRRARP